MRSALFKMAESDAGKPDYSGYKFDEDRIAKLFNELDANQDGKIDINELSDGLKRLGVKHIPGSAEVCWRYSLLRPKLTNHTPDAATHP